jgi:hypothetical protein
MADFNTGDYSHSTANCSNDRVDPSSLVLYGPGAHYSLARSKMQQVLNVYRGPWNGDNNASQYGMSHGYCTHRAASFNYTKYYIAGGLSYW